MSCEHWSCRRSPDRVWAERVAAVVCFPLILVDLAARFAGELRSWRRER